MPTAGQSRASCRVLILEDDPFARRALATLLSLQGHVVTSTASAEEALELLGKEHTDFTHVLVDLVLPSGDAADGTAVMARLKEMKHRAHVAIISSATDQGLISRAMALGPERFYPKPLEIDRLMEWLKGTGCDSAGG